MSVIERLSGMEILDSRGRPTVKARCELASGVVAEASVPSGASTGRAEARELRDGDQKRYAGLGCRKAAANIGGEIAANLRGREIESQRELDQLMVLVDATDDKRRLGANAILAVSIAFARAVARERDVPLYLHFSDILSKEGVSHPDPTLPRLTINLFSGGKHAGGQVPIQDVLLVPASARTIDDGLAMVVAVYQAAARIALSKYGMRALTADEGGLAPDFPNAEAMLEDAVAAIEAAGLRPGADVALAVDVASSQFATGADGAAWKYQLGNRLLDSSAMIDVVAGWVERFPIVSVEDALAEEDWAHWPALRQKISARAIVLGDDLLCTNVLRIAKAVELNAANALLLKVNQIGTLTEAAAAYRAARAAGWRVTISARSGETEDDWLADLAVGWGGDQIKVGSVTHSERLAKYNRLLEIERETSWPVVKWPA